MGDRILGQVSVWCPADVDFMQLTCCNVTCTRCFHIDAQSDESTDNTSETYGGIPRRNYMLLSM